MIRPNSIFLFDSQPVSMIKISFHSHNIEFRLKFCFDVLTSLMHFSSHNLSFNLHFVTNYEKEVIISDTFSTTSDDGDTEESSTEMLL